MSTITAKPVFVRPSAIPQNIWDSMADDAKSAVIAAVAVKGKAPGLTLKVGAKGGLSVYGLGRFPVTLYSSQWLALLDAADKIRAFLTDHADELKSKE